MSLPSGFLDQFGQNSGYIAELYELYQVDPALVGGAWAAVFQGLGNGHSGTNGHHAAGYYPSAVAAPALAARPEEVRRLVEGAAVETGDLQARVVEMIHRYREWGHLQARVSPIVSGSVPPGSAPELAPQFSSEELQAVVDCRGFEGRSTMSLGDLRSALEEVYCGSIGFEYTWLANPAARAWLEARIEGRLSSQSAVGVEQQRRMFEKLVEAEGLEVELHKKYVGAKRFSLQGTDTLIPMLDTLVEESAQRGLEEVVIGMAHRGRLNVLCNIVGKPLGDLFAEFEDQTPAAVIGAGDVKYHMGYAATQLRRAGGTDRKVTVSLAPNPSHLEFINPVEGIVRARQDLGHDRKRNGVVPVLMHGDAAFAGQGVVFETINFAGIDGYRTGGTIHIVVNNQVGFTTNPEESRSSRYCTDMARGTTAPVFHVNSEDVEAAWWAIRTALEFRLEFGQDVIIDLIGYRKYGHNEGDDPSFTQPLMYTEISAKKTIARLYGERLTAAGILSEAAATEAFNAYAEHFATAHRTRTTPPPGEACPVYGALRSPAPADTGVPAEALTRIAGTLTDYPPGFTPHAKLHKILEKRVESLTVGSGIDWGFAEGLAFGSLVLEGRHIRLSGQDAGRGTFSQRHLLLSDYKTGERFLPLSRLGEGRFEVYNSSLSEAAVVGFEFGYGTAAPRTLVLWEAQFGDFANGAQVHIDQFLASSEAKWNQRSGVVMMLPHGFEGQGPEHSSGRLERYLQLCAEGNMTVCYPSKAAQHFHLLRRQALSEVQRPLIVMTPKSLLRHPGASAAVAELTGGRFEPVLVDDLSKGAAEHLVLLTGKVYYDVLAALEKASDKVSEARVKLVRVEQLYPFPGAELRAAMGGMKLKSCTWVQEEPRNMGAWTYIEPLLREELGLDPGYVGRAASASPATGSGKRHSFEQQQIIESLLKRIR